MSIDLVIAGVQKCGTTSLHLMLAQHPKIVTHSSGQWPYFLHEDDYADQYSRYMTDTFKGQNSSIIKLARDTSVSASALASARLKELSPNVRLILMLRDPVARAYSGYTFAKSKQYDIAETFEEELVVEDRFTDDISTYLVRNHIPLSQYHRTMKRLEEHFGKEAVLAIKSEDLKSDPQDVCNRIFDFIGVDKFAVKPLVTNVTRQGRFAALQKLTKTDNLIRRVSKKILPKTVIRWGLRTISKVNTSNKSFEGIPPELESQLRELLNADMQNLRNDYGIEY